MEMGFASVRKENIDLVTHEVVGGLKIVYAVGAGNTIFSFFFYLNFVCLALNIKPDWHSTLHVGCL